MKAHAFIFARGGSKGVPRKNIRLFNNVPLLGHSIKLAQELSVIEHVFVSTEDAEIAQVAENYSGAVIHRPVSLALDETPEWLAWQHAIRWVEDRYGTFDLFLSLPPTSPLRSKVDVERCVTALDDDTDIIVAVTESRRSPWFNIVTETDSGHLRCVIESKYRLDRRQDCPLAYDLTTVAYVARPNFIKTSNGLFDGRVKGVQVPPERAVDIDTTLDFEIAEFLATRQSDSL